MTKNASAVYGLDENSLLLLLFAFELIEVKVVRIAKNLIPVVTNLEECDLILKILY